jgi:nitrite reductase/ring-hydroxylating ferredoxin subunit
MKPTEVASRSVAHPTVWSAPVGAIPPGCSAKIHIFWRGQVVEGFVVNFEGRHHAYVNYCTHAGTPLDWWPNEFLDDDRRFLRCGTHGSLFEPDTGKCAGGPCSGGALFPLQVQVAGGRIVVTAGPDA